MDSHVEILTSVEAIESFVAGLAPPKAGSVRVFRGQAKDYGTLIPSSLRTAAAARGRAIWRAYAHHLTEDIWRDDPVQKGFIERPNHPFHIEGVRGIPNAEKHKVNEIWGQAVVQHYGPGAPFLDVTTSLEIALWFATHHFEQGECPPTVPESFADGDWRRYSGPYTSGYIYVLDAPKWKSADILTPGMLVDLLDAPKIFHSPRILAQAACLIYASETERDLWSEALGLRVAMRKFELLTPPRSREYYDLFPGPEIDDWYDRLLSTPFIPRIEAASETSKGELQASLPVTLYVPRDDEAEALGKRMDTVKPPLLYPGFRNFVDEAKYAAMIPHCPIDLMLNPVPILLEGPVIYSTPQLEANIWHKGLLATDRPVDVPALEFDGAEVTAPVTNVFFEFSPLEYCKWHCADRIEVPRGVWIMDDQLFLYVTFYIGVSRVGEEEHGVTAIGPWQIAYSDFDQQFIWKGTEDDEWFGDHDQPLFKLLFVCLEMLRMLSPAPKPLALPLFMEPLGDEIIHTVMGVRNLLSLKRASFGHHFLLSLTGSNEPYLGMFTDLSKSRTPIGLLKVVQPGAHLFPDVFPHVLRQTVQKAQEEGYPFTFPMRE
ncbi:MULTISPECIES: FRG domain-containing protein [unclassified Novosphingobium]|uniref:FRG domain-containing protein n=1 Tax=unclassified Novosphingobium TaxID=2644732 RepID=UPI00146B7274|nr:MULTISPECIES: FRG domain-containing protein [unclassified Novosphingobium]NMN06416.1 hypothetical protein [Novosphingobium sp. SG919]NMN89140.1 hypothetical protein [Novosphingobium sp. SG916]